MSKKLATIDLKGKAYATVPTRIKEFREMCPNGLIETKPTFLDDGMVLFTTRILKDKSNASSGEGTGNALGTIKGDKNFEKLETISIGRALAILGFMASGDVASFEEMEEFLTVKETEKQLVVQEAKEFIDSISDLKVLKEYYKTHRGLGAELDAYMMDKAKELKNGKN